MNEREQLAKDNGMTIEFVNWFFDNKKDGCGNAWFMMMAAMWEGWSGREAKCAALAADNEKAMEAMRQADEVVRRAHDKFSEMAAETHGFKRFFTFAINAAFDGCDITGDQIQEVAKEIGLVRVEPYSAEKHADMSGDPSIMEEGDDFYIMNKTPATDSFLAEVRAQGVEMFARSLRGEAEITKACTFNPVQQFEDFACRADECAAKLRQDANTADLLAAGIITKVGE